MVLSGGKFIILIELIGADLSHIADILPQIILKAKYWFSLSKPNLNFNFPFTIFFFCEDAKSSGFNPVMLTIMLLEYKTLFLIKTKPLPRCTCILILFFDIFSFFFLPRQMLNYPFGRAKSLTLIAVFHFPSVVFFCTHLPSGGKNEGQVNVKLSRKTVKGLIKSLGNWNAEAKRRRNYRANKKVVASFRIKWTIFCCCQMQA